ncbi:MAG: hypothetical protein AAF439_01755 [Pseudomonadota bacterium]
MLIAIGGIVIKSLLHRPAFFWYAAPALWQAKSAPGCLFSDVRGVRGVQFSLTAWESTAAMKAYAHSEPHAVAMRRTEALSSFGAFHHYQSDALSDWEEALARWDDAVDYPGWRLAG